MSDYSWKFSTIGGKNRVNIQSGEDIKHLCDLDQKLWTVLSCPVTSLEFDSKTLRMLDSNNDGRIHVNEVVQAANWVCSIIKDPDLLLKREDELPLCAFNTDNPDGRRLLASAKQILANLGVEKDSISVADTDDSVSIFSKTALNGDGIITVQSTTDEVLSTTIANCIDTIGSKDDRSGKKGVDAELVETFYTTLAQYAAWQDKANQDSSILVYGASTPVIFDLVNSIKPKVADYFMRCKLAQFHKGSSNALDVSVNSIETISTKNLSECTNEISGYPLARITESNTFPLDGRINPVWQSTFNKLRTLVLNEEFAGATEITEEQWESFVSKLSAYESWIGSKVGAQVEPLGLDAVKALLKADRKADLLRLIEEDKALESESQSIDEVNKLLHLYRDFYAFLCNFVSFKDFYDPNEKAVFQAGQLFIDERCCDLCIKVTDMSLHNAAAALGGMYILYCNCSNNGTGGTMTIAAVLTDGDISDLREGKHGLFYDRSGKEWEATVFKIVDNPISISQAFWSPYRKIGRFVEKTIEKNAADKDSKVFADITAQVSAPGEKKQMFDIGKFAGIFAAIGLAFSAIGLALAKIVETLSSLMIWQWLAIIVGIVAVISGPAMILAWLKLRKRTLSPLLNANGWAINAAVKVNVTFGSTLTKVGKTPMVADPDPFADKTPVWKKIIGCLLGVAILFWILFSSNLLFKITKSEKLHYKKNAKEKVEKTEEIQVPAENAESMLIVTLDDLMA